MRQAGLLHAREEGRWIYYHLRREALAALQVWLGDLSDTCDRPATPCR
jgi:ArsR family transcriptional regulator